MDKNFETHKATLLLHQDNLYLIDFRREDGRRHYWVRFFVDTKISSVHIEGDLGHCISCWGNENTLANISDMMLNTSYWIGKFCCSSDVYVYDEKVARKDLENDTYDALEAMTPDDYSDYIDSIMETFSDNSGLTLNTDASRDAMVELMGLDSLWERPHYGRKVHPRVYLWAEAFDLALKQLNLK